MISRVDAFRTWLKIGLLSFGGPAGQIALMHKVLVEEKNWVSETRFMHALNYCMLLPGPEAMQLATYIGWLLHRTWGGIVAGLLFVLPGATLMMILSAVYAAYHDVPLVAALFFGLKSAVLVLVVEALIRIGRKSLHNNALKALAAVSFISIFFLGAPFPAIIVAAGAAGLAFPRIFSSKPKQDTKTAAEGSVIDRMQAQGLLAHAQPNTAHALITLACGLALWLLPLLAWHGVYRDIGVFFSKMAVVTFGGAYAVLAYVAQVAVEHYRWLSSGDMLNGLGLAETTPGPLILVLQYVGYLAGYGAGQSHIGGVAGACIALWVTFVPCFLWIFLGAPYMEQLRHKPALAAALTAITAAVTGVILNLAIWFALHVLFRDVAPQHAGIVTYYKVSGIDIAAAVLAGIAAVCSFKLKWGTPATLALCAALGLVVKLVLKT